MFTLLGRVYAFITTIIFIVLTGCSGTNPGDSLDINDSQNLADVKALESIIVEQGNKILLIEKRELNKRGKLLNKTFMFTGKLKGISRAEAKTLIEKNSGSIVSTVNKKLNFLVTGDKPTNKKINHANQLGVKILSQDEWFKFLN